MTALRSLWAALTAVLLLLSGGVALSAAPAAAAPPQTISCAPGTVYAISAAGQLRKVTNGSSTDVGNPATGVASFNGLGIGTGGSPVYAIERSTSEGNNSSATVFTYNATAGTWSSTGRSTGATGTNLVAGAADLNSNQYYFGGFSAGGGTFKIYRYNPDANAISLTGWIDTSAGSGASANGDMAFDRNGNLFVVRGSGSTTTIFSVTAANLAAGTGGQITAARSAGFATSTNVNGVAFDGNGKGYLGSAVDVYSYDQPDWSNESGFYTPASWSSTDLASCSSPATITVQKVIQGGRAKASDQFTLSAQQGSTLLGTATTTGSASGAQKEIVGALPVKRGTTIDFSESGAGGTSLSDYASSYACTVDGTAISGATGTGTSGRVTIPGSGQAVVCTITNAPLTAAVTVHKDVVDAEGKNSAPGKGWTLEAAATATTDSVSQGPVANTQQTDSNGDAKWALKFSKSTGRATVAISETQQPGYEFSSGTCVVTGLDGSTATTKLTSGARTNLTGIKPGDDVRCAYTNKVKDTFLTLVKKVDNATAAGTAAPTDWTLKAAGPSALSGSTGTAAVTKVKVRTGDYTLSETGGPAGYDASDWVCGPSGGAATTLAGGKLTLTAGDDMTCTVTNTAKTGSVDWRKTDNAGNALNGAVWTLKGPGGATLTVEDCAAASASACTGPDKNPQGGAYSLTGLQWGDYTLVEKKAPAGYVLDASERKFTISGTKLTQTIGPFANVQKSPVFLPNTGGTGSQIFIIGGAALIAAGGVLALLKGLRRRNRKH